MFCPYCGSEVTDGAPFCSSCGKPVEADAPQTDQPDQQPAAVQVAATQTAVAATPTAAVPAPPAAPAAYPAVAAPAMAAPVPGAVYTMTEKDKNLRLANFILCVISTVAVCWAVIPLAWMIPMTVHSYGIYQGKKANTTAFGVLTLIFVTLAGGICLLVSDKNE